MWSIVRTRSHSGVAFAKADIYRSADLRLSSFRATSGKQVTQQCNLRHTALDLLPRRPFRSRSLPRLSVSIYLLIYVYRRARASPLRLVAEESSRLDYFLPRLWLIVRAMFFWSIISPTSFRGVRSEAVFRSFARVWPRDAHPAAARSCPAHPVWPIACVTYAGRFTTNRSGRPSAASRLLFLFFSFVAFSFFFRLFIILFLFRLFVTFHWRRKSWNQRSQVIFVILTDGLVVDDVKRTFSFSRCS